MRESVTRRSSPIVSVMLSLGACLIHRWGSQTQAKRRPWEKPTGVLRGTILIAPIDAMYLRTCAYKRREAGNSAKS